MNLLKEHNTFLTSENEKLAKACEKYMADAKQANKLRQEIISLKEEMNKKYVLVSDQSLEISVSKEMV